MLAYRLTALATLAMVGTYLWTILMVGRARGTYQVKAPAISGPEPFNRIHRVQVNTLEQTVLMLPVLWLFALTAGDVWAAGTGLLWLVGRWLYIVTYTADAEKRGPGFGIGFLAFVIAFLGSLGAIVASLLR